MLRAAQYCGHERRHGLAKRVGGAFKAFNKRSDERIKVARSREGCVCGCVLEDGAKELINGILINCCP